MLQDIPVKRYMFRYVFTFKPEQEILEAAKLMADWGASGVPVIEDIGNLYLKKYSFHNINVPNV